jgi:uncharacterized membrane protein YidH (DUF202 family)
MPKPTLHILAVILSIALIEPAFAQQIDPELGAEHALKQVGGLAALLFSATVIGGTMMVIGSIKRWMNAESNERETMGAGKLLIGVTIGTAAVILPFIIVLGGATMFGELSNPVAPAEFQAMALDGDLAQASTLSVQNGPGKYVPAGALIAFYGILIAIGIISLYMGLRDAYLAIMFGNDMYGTSMPFKTGKVLAHMIFGFGLIFLNQTQCLMVLTFGGTESMCW